MVAPIVQIHTAAQFYSAPSGVTDQFFSAFTWSARTSKTTANILHCLCRAIVQSNRNFVYASDSVRTFVCISFALSRRCVYSILKSPSQPAPAACFKLTNQGNVTALCFHDRPTVLQCWVWRRRVHKKRLSKHWSTNKKKKTEKIKNQKRINAKTHFQHCLSVFCFIFFSLLAASVTSVICCIYISHSRSLFSVSSVIYTQILVFGNTISCTHRIKIESHRGMP